MRIVLAVAVELGQIGECQRVGGAARHSLLQQMERALNVCGVLLAQTDHGVSQSQVPPARRAGPEGNQIGVRRQGAARRSSAPPDRMIREDHMLDVAGGIARHRAGHPYYRSVDR
jgi:hypothetical protein